MGVSLLLSLTPLPIYPLTHQVSCRMDRRINNTAVSDAHQVKMNMSRQSRQPRRKS